MDKTLIRLSIIGIAFYLIICYTANLIFNVNLWIPDYTLLYELCVCLCMSKQGVYHCKYIKHTAYGILASDALISVDAHWNIIPINILAVIIAIIIASALLVTTSLAIRHFVRILIIKTKRHEQSYIQAK